MPISSVETTSNGLPRAVNGIGVEKIIDAWVTPVGRAYYRVRLVNGANLTVYNDDGTWGPSIDHAGE